MSPIPSDGAVRTDSELVRRIGAGDTDAFEKVMREHGPRLIRLAYGITGQIDEAEDIAQESLLTLWNMAEAWKARSTIAAYLRTVATRKAIDVLRHRKRQVDDFQWEDLLEPGAGPQTQLEQQDDTTMVRQLMSELPDRQRTALVLAHFEGCSHRDGADAMGIDVEAYSSLLARARRSLRKAVEGAMGARKDGE